MMSMMTTLLIMSEVTRNTLQLLRIALSSYLLPFKCNFKGENLFKNQPICCDTTICVPRNKHVHIQYCYFITYHDTIIPTPAAVWLGLICEHVFS
jgi:hypothetical protein